MSNFLYIFILIDAHILDGLQFIFIVWLINGFYANLTAQDAPLGGKSVLAPCTHWLYEWLALSRVQLQLRAQNMVTEILRWSWWLYHPRTLDSVELARCLAAGRLLYHRCAGQKRLISLLIGEFLDSDIRESSNLFYNGLVASSFDSISLSLRRFFKLLLRSLLGQC